MRRPRVTRSRFDDRRLAVPEQPAAAGLGADRTELPDITLACPRCQEDASLATGFCGNCGFPFVCDLDQPDQPGPVRLRNEVWRILLGLAAILFLLGSGAFYDLGIDEFNGRTFVLVQSVPPDTDSGIKLNGPQNFIWRSELVLGLLEQRAPDFYWRIQDSVTEIEYLAPNYLEGPEGRKITLEGIGALAHPASGKVSVLYSTAFPSGPGETYDRDLYIYAGVLVHELRHIELYASGLGPGGMAEEVLCEQAAYAAMLQLNAPPGLLTRYEVFLRDPEHERYQDWYDWYDQWD